MGKENKASEETDVMEFLRKHDLGYRKLSRQTTVNIPEEYFRRYDFRDTEGFRIIDVGDGTLRLTPKSKEYDKWKEEKKE
jgi:hypothetical protein